MPNVIQLTANGGRRHATVTIDDALAARPAVDFVFDILGAEPLEDLVEDGVLAEGDLVDMRAIQAAVFDRDAEGFLIRDGVEFWAGGKAVNPDLPLTQALSKIEQGGVVYSRCDLVIKAPGDRPAEAPPARAATPAAPAAPQQSREAQMRLFAKMLFLHRLATGTLVDVTKDSPDLVDVLAECEKEQLVEIDVKKASYALTAAGRRLHEGWLGEAQELIKRYDIYGDVDVDASGRVRFDTGVGQDWRVAVYELASIDPFKARFLIGLNDGEWDHLEGWEGCLSNTAWYEEIFAPVEAAASVEQVGRDRLLHVMDQAKIALREDGAFH